MLCYKVHTSNSELPSSSSDEISIPDIVICSTNNNQDHNRKRNCSINLEFKTTGSVFPIYKSYIYIYLLLENNKIIIELNTN